MCSFLALKSVLGMGDLVPGEGAGRMLDREGIGRRTVRLSPGEIGLSLPPPPSYAPLFTLRASLWRLRGVPCPSPALPPLALPAIPFLPTLNL